MIEELLGSKSKERVLLFIFAKNEGYARQIADYFKASLTPIQNQLNNLEKEGVLVCKPKGKTLMYYLNPRYPFIKELKALLQKVLDSMPDRESEKLLFNRRRPRRKDKPL